MLTAAGTIGPNERLIIRYRTQLDANTQNGVALTNVAGAIQWFNGDSSNPNRLPYTRTLTNGTEGTLDHEDAHTVTVALTGYFFEKTVANLTTGVNPTTTAAPGDRLRYTLRLRTTDQALTNFRIFDDLDALNAATGLRARHADARHVSGRRRHQRHQQHGRHQGHRRPRHPQPESCRPTARS